MSIYDKTVANITTEDLAELLQEKAVENIRLEFKSQDVEKDEWKKKLSAFANTHGGFVILGAAEHSGGKLAGFPGLDKIPGLKNKLVDICYSGIYPLVQPYVSEPIASPDTPGKSCYVVYVDDSAEAPHFLNSRKGAYVRTDERSQQLRTQLATYEELSHLANRRERAVQRRDRLLERARQRFDQLVTEKYGSHSRTTGTIGATLEIFVSPRFPSAQLALHGDLPSLLELDRVEWKGGWFPVLGYLSTQQESALAAGATYSFSLLEIGVWGNLFLAAEVEHSVPTRGGAQTSGIYKEAVMGLLLVTLEKCRSLYEQIAYMGMLDISVRIHRSRNTPWVQDAFMDYDSGPTPTLDDDATANLEIDVRLLARHRDDLAKELAKSLLYSLNWRVAASSPHTMDSFLQAGYSFNGWKWQS